MHRTAVLLLPHSADEPDCHSSRDCELQEEGEAAPAADTAAVLPGVVREPRLVTPDESPGTVTVLPADS